MPLTFEDPEDYERIQADDRVSLLGLNDLTPGRPVQCLLKHGDGSEETVQLRHTMNAGQIAWFRAGSAMNHMKNLEGAG